MRLSLDARHLMLSSECLGVLLEVNVISGRRGLEETEVTVQESWGGGRTLDHVLRWDSFSQTSREPQ